MCLLAVGFRCVPELPLVVAANRDERYARPTIPAALLDGEPRMIAGRDEEAGGTWLAVNEWGVVAGLTNQPAVGGRDMSKRSRGELPFLLARHDRAAAAAEAFVAEVNPNAYNPCSLLVGDRHSLHSLELRDGAATVEVRDLEPGQYVLENRPFGIATAKTQYIDKRLRTALLDDGEEQLRGALEGLLADETVPPDAGFDAESRRPESLAACVCTPDYGTRSSTIVFVPDAPQHEPVVFVTDGPPCANPFREVRWR